MLSFSGIAVPLNIKKELLGPVVTIVYSQIKMSEAL